MKNTDDVAVFWDHENCPAPTNASGYTIVNNIRSVIQNFGSVKLFRAYLEVTGHVPVSRATVLRSELQSSGVSLTDCPHNGKKIVSDKMILVDMLAHAIDNPAPSTIVLISGDRDFAYALSILRLRRYRIVLITLSNAHPSLRAQASLCFDWVSDVLEPVDPVCSRQSIYPRGGKTSSPPGHDKPYLEFNGYNSRLPFQGSFDEKSAKTVEFMDYFQDATRRRENSRTPPEHDAKHDFVRPGLGQSKRQPAVSSVASTTLHNEPEFPARVIYSPAASSCYTYINGGIETPLTMTARGSNYSQTTPTSSTSTGNDDHEGIMPSRSYPHSIVGGSNLSNLAQHKVASVTEPVPFGPAIQMLSAEPHPSSQREAYSLNNAKTQILSSVDQLDDGDSDPPSHLDISQPPNVTNPLSAPAPSFILPSCLSNATASATTTESSVKAANPPQPTSFPIVPDKFKILIQYLKLHRLKGSLRPLRSLIGLEIARNGATYRQAGVLKFSQYVTMAEKAGIVELGGSDGTSWIALKAPWCDTPLS